VEYGISPIGSAIWLTGVRHKCGRALDGGFVRVLSACQIIWEDVKYYMATIFEACGIQMRHKIVNENDYICITDMAKFKPQESYLVIGHWMRSRNTIDYLTAWETLYNPDFNPTEIGRFREDCSLNNFTMTPQKWVENTNGIGIFSKSGRYDGGTYAHKDIAFKFASWLSVELELYVIKEFQRLKIAEQQQLRWTAERELAKVNYHVQTDAIKENLIVPELTEKQKTFVYADEADLLNVALFGMTAKEWRTKNPNLDGNMRDHTSHRFLNVLSNMELFNAYMIGKKTPQKERIVELNKFARQHFISQAKVEKRLLLTGNKSKP